ncbi:SDR family oxidoreductase [Streptomyces durocortorensis]|uniref:SDR family oxidoreductase n=1 Tax=Streptomyces durocortorensis TaxID=2811104 RepID=A0ABS2I2D0_9ACTN|nr:SDR family oxidoreductase [Streptomyces durocortorensis]MBM7057371.1 SDR family oxidoreductase [Streptomyces durocortorensis]
MHDSPGGRPIRRVPARPLDGRTAVVTGAARGVGQALARSLSDAGMRVALLGRERATLLETAASLAGPSICVVCDVTDRSALAHAARRVETEFGPAAVVVANAGIAVSGPFDRTAAELWQRVIDVNLIGSANTARAFLPQLTAARGYFLQIASTAAFGSAPMMSAYCASKAGAESFALALRGEVEPDGVQVGIAYLHWTGTDMLTGIDDHPVLEALRRNQPRPARRVHTAAQVAEWLTRGITHRAPHIYAPPWLRWCQPLRPLFPALVARATRRELRSRPSEDMSSPVEVLGAGGRADWNSYRASRPAPPPDR